MCFWRIQATLLACIFWLGFWSMGRPSKFFPWVSFLSSSSFYWQSTLSWWCCGYRIVSDALICSTKCGKYNSPNKDKRTTENDWKIVPGNNGTSTFQGYTQCFRQFSVPYAESSYNFKCMYSKLFTTTEIMNQTLPGMADTLIARVQL